jgi:phage/plasmid primase-like uncharacterized protein
MVNADFIASALGLKRSGRTHTGACPNCGYRGFTIQERGGRTLFFCHAGGCAQDDIIEALRAHGLWGDGRGPAWRQPPPRRDETMLQAALALWRRSQPAEGTLVEAYLRARGIRIPIPATLRYLPSGRHPATNQVFPTMIAAVARVPDGAVCAVHRTFLRRDGGGKAAVDNAKASLGPIGDGAVRLAEARRTVVVAEGVETGLSVMQALGLPVWAALSAGGMQRLVLPAQPFAAEVHIAADNDATGVGQRAAEAAALRWMGEGRRVRIAQPPGTDTDFNDMLRTSGDANAAGQ